MYHSFKMINNQIVGFGPVKKLYNKIIKEQALVFKFSSQFINLLLPVVVDYLYISK